MSLKIVTLSIVSHNQGELVQNLLNTLDDYLIHSDLVVRIVVTENTDSTWRPYSAKHSLTYIENLRPKGFGDNHNTVFENNKCDYFLVVNPDILLIQPFNLDNLIDIMKTNDIAIASPLIINTDLVLEDFRRSDITLINLIKRHLFSKPDKKFDWFAGMFLVLDAKAFKTLKGFDTKFYMYVEDCDLCMRARKKSLKLKDIDFISVVHNSRRDSRKKISSTLTHARSIIRYWFSI